MKYIEEAGGWGSTCPLDLSDVPFRQVEVPAEATVATSPAAEAAPAAAEKAPKGEHLHASVCVDRRRVIVFQCGATPVK